MADLKFGIIYSALEEIIGPGEMAKQCEDWGYDSFWVPDFVLMPRLEAMAALAAAAQATSTIRLGTAVIVVPFRHPIQLAKSAVAVDRLSNGRLMRVDGLARSAVQRPGTLFEGHEMIDYVSGRECAFRPVLDEAAKVGEQHRTIGLVLDHAIGR